MGLYDQIKRYFYDNTGMVSLYADGPCDNLFLFQAHASALADRLGENDFAAELANAGTGYAWKCHVRPGLLRRRPDDFGAGSYDEVFGACYLGWRLGQFNPACAVYTYGMDHWFCYDVENPGKLSWRFFFGRNITFIPFIRACARLKVGVIGQSAWVLGAWLSLLTPKSNTSGKLLIDAQILPLWETGWIAKVGIQVWLYFMKRQYRGGRLEIYSTYFPNHPLGFMQKAEWSLR